MAIAGSGHLCRMDSVYLLVVLHRNPGPLPWGPNIHTLHNDNLGQKLLTINLQPLSAKQHQETVVGDLLPLQIERRHGTSATFRTYFIYNISTTQNNRDSMPNAVLKPFLLVRFLCGVTKKMDPGVEPGLDDLD